MSTTTRISQLAGATTFPSSSSLSSMSPLSPTSTLVSAQAASAALASGQVVATHNIINEKADASRSLYQICVSLKERLALVPGFEPYLAQLESFSQDDTDGGPVESLWRLLRTGYPLLAIYNALDPDNPLQPEEQPTDSDQKRSQRCVYKFLQACHVQLKIPTSDCFMITELRGNDTTGFVKVCMT